MLRTVLLSLAASIAAAPPPVAAPPSATSGDDPTIIVTGRRDPEKERREFVRALTSIQFGGIARFEQAVCPIALGLPPGQASALAARMRTVAAAVGVQTAGGKCAPNVVVIVADDKPAFLVELRQHHPGYFGALPNARVKALLREPGPAAAWQLQGPPVSARGTELVFDEATGMYTNRTTESASRINAAARPQFDGAVVVVDRKSLDGLTVTQLADYAAMRAFAAADPKRLQGTATPTILNVLEAPDDAEVPASMTTWDFGLLRGLYTAQRNLDTGAQRSAIQKAMERQVQKSGGK